MFDTQTTATIIIPAYNEGAVIGHTLDALCHNMCVGEFDLIIVCNGCTDATAEVARTHAPHARIIDIVKAGKTDALNTALAEVTTYPVVFLDADIETSVQSVHILVHRLNWSGAHLAYGSAKFCTKGSNPLVHAFYGAWMQNPYFDQQKMGGMFAISEAGLKELRTFPNTTNDDEYVRRTLMHNATWAQQAVYKVKAPRSINSLVKVRSRVYRGNKELEQTTVALSKDVKNSNNRRFLNRIAKHPHLWLGAVVFAFVALFAHMRNKLRTLTGETVQWEQDASTRQNI